MLCTSHARYGQRLPEFNCERQRDDYRYDNLQGRIGTIIDFITKFYIGFSVLMQNFIFCKGCCLFIEPLKHLEILKFALGQFIFVLAYENSGHRSIWGLFCTATEPSIPLWLYHKRAGFD